MLIDRLGETVRDLLIRLDERDLVKIAAQSYDDDGIAYLAYLGVRALLDRGADYVSKTRGAGSRAFRLGLTTQLANPKMMLFFGALLPQFVDPARPVALQFRSARRDVRRFRRARFHRLRYGRASGAQVPE